MTESFVAQSSTLPYRRFEICATRRRVLSRIPRRSDRTSASWLLSLLSLLLPNRTQAEDRFDFKHEQYLEEHGRIEIGTTAARLEKALTASLAVKGEFVYDSISGATPTGGPPLPGSNQVPMQEIWDIRRAGTVELAQRWGRHTVAPQFAYSIENDSFGIWAHTGSLGWNQNVGPHWIVQPSVRIYDQTAARFYTLRVPAQFGDPQIPLNGFPEFYSADYRVSSLRTWTYGVKATWKLHEHFWLDAAYKRYEMSGHDNITFAGAYPKANVFTLGVVIWF